MIRYHFDLYPKDDPEGGTRLVRFTQLQSAKYRGEANGTGMGSFSIRATDSEAAFIDPKGLQYVRVVRDDGDTELVIGGFFLERGQFSILTGTTTKLLELGGTGSLAYFQRAVMDADSWIDDPFIGHDPQPDGTWPLHLAGTGNSLGAIAWRILHELEEPGRHQNPVPAMSLGFTYLLDSNGDPWVRTSGDFVAQVGESVYSIITRLMQLGLYVEVDPHTFEVRAYEPETHRRDRTGSSFAADVVRFQAGANVKSDATRQLEAPIQRNALLVGSNDSWLWVDNPDADVPWEGGYILDDEAGTSLEAAGDAQIAARSDAGDTLLLRMLLGDNETEGEYLPFEHVLLDDLVTVHTGTGQWEFDEQTFPVAALTLTLRVGGDWDCWVDLGSTYTSMAERAFQAQPVKAHNHPPNPHLCRTSAAATVLYDLDFNGADADSLLVPIYPSGTDHWPNNPAFRSDSNPVGHNGGACVVWGGSFPDAQPHSPKLPVTPGTLYNWRAWVMARNANNNDPHDLLTVSFFTAADALLSSFGLAYAVPQDTWLEYSDSYLAPATAAYMVLEVEGWGNGTGHAYDDVLVTSGTPGGGDVPADTVAQGDETFGTGSGAAPCDHAHAHGLLSEGETHYHDVDHIKDLTGITLSDDDPLMEGAADPGTSDEVSRSDHVHPEDDDSGGGGGGGGWTLLVDEDGSSAAGWTAQDGTWSSNGTKFVGDNDGDNQYRSFRFNTKVPFGAGVVAEATFRFPTTGQGTGLDVIAGMDFAHTGSTPDTNISFDLYPNRDWLLALTNETTILRTFTPTLALDTDYVLRVAMNGPFWSVWLDGTLLGSGEAGRYIAAIGDYFAFHTYNALIHISDVKVWHTALP